MKGKSLDKSSLDLLLSLEKIRANKDFFLESMDTHCETGLAAKRSASANGFSKGSFGISVGVNKPKRS